MDRRRGPGTKTRPASADGTSKATSSSLLCSCLRNCYLEVRLWAQTFSSLQELSRLQSSTATTETWQRVNKWMGSLPHDEALQMESLEHFKSVRTKLTAGLGELKTASEVESKFVGLLPSYSKSCRSDELVTMLPELSKQPWRPCRY